MRRRFVTLLIPLLLCACGKTAVYTKLGEADANDALYTLLQGGVDADKRAEADSGSGAAPLFSLWVPKDEQARAIGLLKANGQPELKHATLGELFGRNQLISTPGEERIRFVCGIEQALAQTLSQIDGVLVARVHIVLPLNDPLSNELKPSSASVFIKHRAGQDLNADVPAVKDLVVRSIEGLGVDRVAVTLFAAGRVAGAQGPAAGLTGIESDVPTSQFLGTRVPATSVPALWLRLLGAAVVGAVVLTLLRVLLGRSRDGGNGSRTPIRSSAVATRREVPPHA